MAGIRKKGDAYYCTFRFQGRCYYFTVGYVPEAQALAKGAEVDETLGLLERGRLTIPEGVSLEEFVAAGGKTPVVAVRPETVTARNLIDRYLATHANGTIEENSLGNSIFALLLSKTTRAGLRVPGSSLPCGLFLSREITPPHTPDSAPASARPRCVSCPCARRSSRLDRV
jgi:hypothetical protein